jgi:DNA polymerase-3 subunit gamma/tau
MDQPPLTGADPQKGYLVLARKYRPQRFEDLIGQEAMVRTLTNAFALDRVAHAFMLTGVRGVGKTTTARLLARAFNYTRPGHEAPSMTLDPPGTQCAAIAAGRHPDVLEMDAASRTGVGDIREILEGVRYAPLEARTKVYIIDEVHMLSTAAFNALLKTLEEPPSHVKFIFATTEIRKMPVTVLSRCQRFDLRRIEPDEMARHLTAILSAEGARLAPAALQLVVRAAEGSVRDALSLLEQALVQPAGPDGEVPVETVRDMLGLADRARALDLLEALVRADAAAALAELDGQIAVGADAPSLLRDLMDIVHEAARVQVLGDGARIAESADWAARLRALALHVPAGKLSRLWQMLLRGFEEALKAPDPHTAGAMAIIRIAVAMDLPGPEEAARLLRGAASEGTGGHGGTASPASNADEGTGPRGQGGRITRLHPAQGSATSPPTAGNLALARDRDTAAAAPPPSALARDGFAAASLHIVTSAIDTEDDTRAAQDDEDDEREPPPPLDDFDDVLRALAGVRDMELLIDCERGVRLVSFEPGRIRFSPAPGAPRDLAFRLAGALTRIGRRRWTVEVASGPAAETVSERRLRERQQLLAEISDNPEVRRVLDLIPGAKVISVRTPDGDNVVEVAFDYRNGDLE